ncbi:hypothetical protein H310_04973 [Aphanomyces invadans]|uniref:Uncharacterized protein n=1 Tax=Aphanomyces invadans TaxID=157072 RepID=A0A024UAW3_9STRA|nr:hypothetical protein H310_04973 [Aphanomyces invadans]ETW03556.1 hypothetical protein H310_04973 [Aphanomyces invadans]|eukprot:XP_008867785.1 hypothetical protein H310_04973 [Aphanomyces invadans]
MKGAYLFAVLVGIKTILADTHEGAAVRFNKVDNDDDSFGELHDNDSFGERDENDSFEEDDENDSFGEFNHKRSFGGVIDNDSFGEGGDNDSFGEGGYYSKPSYGGKATYNKYGKGGYGKTPKSYNDNDHDNDSYSNNKPGYGKKPVNKPSYSKKPVTKPSYRDDDYKPAKVNYGKPNKKPTKPGYGNIHGDDYDDDDYHTYPSPVYEPWTAHYAKDTEIPFPYTYFTQPDAPTILKVPKLGDYHCFLTGAPWTSCGRKSLTNYFLDQCLALHFTLSANVDGICGGEPPKPTPKPSEYNDDYYGPGYKKHPISEPMATTAPKPTKKPEEGGYGTPATAAPSEAPYEITPDYLKEKCLQSAYVSITTATVMCLTENYIRINFIEHYAADACNNPVEGPTLYLRKLHDFIKEVIKCNPTAGADYPNLYRSFDASANTGYNPNAPFYVSPSDKKTVYLQDYTSGEASGLAAFTIGDRFACANPNHLIPSPTSSGAYLYLNIPSTTHYWTGMNVPDGGAVFNPKNKYSNFKSSAALAALKDRAYRYCKNADYTTDRTLVGLYDSVHYIERDTSALRRPQSIAEIAVRSAGVHEQPILEGFGILYYCAFHACRANNHGDLSKCYPTFNSDKDWSLPPRTLKAESDAVTKCIDDDYLTTEDITTNQFVQTYNYLLSKRSYLCLAESEIVDFLTLVYPQWATEDDAISLVYGRHLADERAEIEGEDTCPSTRDIYSVLHTALNDLIRQCADNKAKAIKHKIYGKPQYGNPQYGDPYGRPAKYDA